MLVFVFNAVGGFWISLNNLWDVTLPDSNRQYVTFCCQKPINTLTGFLRLIRHLTGMTDRRGVPCGNPIFAVCIGQSFPDFRCLFQVFQEECQLKRAQECQEFLCTVEVSHCFLLFHSIVHTIFSSAECFGCSARVKRRIVWLQQTKDCTITVSVQMFNFFLKFCERCEKQSRRNKQDQTATKGDRRWP